jgi:hypothetical protein
MPAAILAFLGLAAQDLTEQERLDFYEKKIRPVLAERCYTCHSARAEDVKGGLLLDSREAVLRGGQTGPAVVPGDPDRSPLIRAIRYADDDFRMPPRSRLTPQQVADFEAWVRMGAPAAVEKAAAAPPARLSPEALARAARTWPFRPPVAAPPPAVNDAGWPRTSIDPFILARLEERGLRPVADADRRTLIRRVTYDLTGVPPTPEEVERFVSDPSPEAYAKVVDRLLASPRYGERWGRHWLDVVRYADTAGDSADYPVPQAHRYRDYVIRAFNEDRPYDRFMKEQIAGDLLEAADDEERRRGIIATGFLALARRFGEEPSVDHALTIDDAIDTLGRTFLGLTPSCARCHDHKFDPIPQEDYYGLYGVLQSTRFPYAGSDKVKYQKDFVPLIDPAEAARILQPFEEKLAALDAEARPLQEEIARRERTLAGGKAEDRPTDGRSLQELRKALGEVQKKRESFAKSRPSIEDAYAVGEGTPEDARIHVKGNPRHLGDVVPRRFLQVLGGAPLAGGSGRLALAARLADPANPLPARVMANRIWQYHFGRGLVQTPSYFGRQGTPPTHPELLDHLALEFVKSGWSVKALHRRILLSRTYQLSGAGGREQAGADPANELLWKFPRRRLEAEAIRDAMLAVSGQLDLTPAGPHPFPPREQWNFSKASPFYAVYPTDRRSVYLMQQRLKRHPYLALFDGPDPNQGVATRAVTTTSIQALFLLNSPFMHAQAASFAARIRAAGSDVRERIDWAHRAAFARPARTAELQRGEAFLQELGGGPEAWTSYAHVLLSSNEFSYVD